MDRGPSVFNSQQKTLFSKNTRKSQSQVMMLQKGRTQPCSVLRTVLRSRSASDIGTRKNRSRRRGGELKSSGGKKEKKSVRIELRKSGEIRANPKVVTEKSAGVGEKAPPQPRTDAPLDSCICVPSDKLIASLKYLGTFRTSQVAKCSTCFGRFRYHPCNINMSSCWSESGGGTSCMHCI